MAILPPIPVQPVLISEAPTIKRIGEHFHIIDTYQGAVVCIRAMPASVFFETFRRYAEAGQDWRVEQSGKVERIDNWREALPG